MPFPGQRVAENDVDIVILRRPGERPANAIIGGDNRIDVARATRVNLDREIVSGYPLQGGDNFEDRITASVAAIQRHRCAALGDCGLTGASSSTICVCGVP